jgi:two-component system CheB/CheR fusion protein
MPVVVAVSELQVQADRVYVLPPNADLSIEGYLLKVVSPPRRVSRQLDCLLWSLANSKKEHAIGIVLSGYLHDGTEGCKHIKAKGGTNIIQDQSAEVSSMPLSALASGCIDFVLPPNKMPGELLRLSERIRHATL